MRWVLLGCLFFCFASSSFASEAFPNLESLAVLIYDADFDQVLYAKNADVPRSIASLTKIMTLLLCLELIEERGLSWDEQVTASATAESRGGTQIDLKRGDTLRMEELLYATALASANDAAVALAEYFAGTEKDFARKMSTRAKELGLVRTNFADSTGLVSIYSDSYSTAYEITRLAQFAMQNETFRQLVSTKEYALESRSQTLKNSNVLLQNPWVHGVKTGATTPAGHCLVTSANLRGRHVIITVLGAPSRLQRNLESQELLNYVLSRQEVLIGKNEVVADLVVTNGVSHTVPVIPIGEVSVFAMNGPYAVKLELHEVKAPLTVTDKVGEVIIFEGEGEYGRVDLVPKHATGLASIFRRIVTRILGLFQGLSKGGRT